MRNFAFFYLEPLWWRVGVGVLAAGSGGLLRFALADQLGTRIAYLTLYPAVGIAALIGGFASGLAAAVISALMVLVWISPLADLGDWIGLGVFSISATILSLLTEVLHRTWARLSAAQAKDQLHMARENVLKALTSGFVHEVNQPLSATAAYVKTAQRLAATLEQPDQTADLLAKADKQIARAALTVRRLRDLITLGEPQKAPVKLHELIRDSYAASDLGAKEPELQVTFRLNARRDHVLVDAVLIQQVLVNILRNAAEAIATVPVKEIVIETSSDNINIRLDIADNGVGLLEKTTLFEPFRTTKPTGMGVGLALCRAIVEAHHGKIWAESNPSGGATFSFTLPLSRN